MTSPKDTPTREQVEKALDRVISAAKDRAVNRENERAEIYAATDMLRDVVPVEKAEYERLRRVVGFHLESVHPVAVNSGRVSGGGGSRAWLRKTIRHPLAPASD